MNFSLPRLAVNRPVAVAMLSLTMLGLGLIAWYRLPLTFLPRAESPVVLCIFPYPGAGPSQVEQQIAIPVEGEFRTIPGLTRIETRSYSDGCHVEMLFKLDANMSRVTGELRDRIERLKLVLPKEVERVQMQRFSIDSVPVMVLGLFSSGDPEEFSYRVRRVVEPRIRRLPGVANVQIESPTPPREVLIEFQQDTLRAMNIALTDVVQSITENSTNLSLGELTDSNVRYYVRYEGEYKSIDDIQRIVVAPNGLRLGDVARVRYSAREAWSRVTLDGADGLILLITKESQANTVQTCKAIREEVQRILSMPSFSDASFLPFFDQSEFIAKALRNLFLQGIYGTVMAISVLLVFMHRLLPTALVTLSIPTSLVFALVFMFFFKMSLNIITLVSMIIAVGMLVDNAIVVVENILRYRSQGMPIREAIVKGPQEVSLAIFASTATTWVVFLPMFYMQVGSMSVFMGQLGGPLIASLGGSLIIALTLIPLIMGFLEKVTSNKATRSNRFTVPIDGILGLGRYIIDTIIAGYGVLLEVCLRCRFIFIVAIFAIIAITIKYPMKTVGMRALPKLDMREVTIDVSLASNYGMRGATELFKRLEDEIKALREPLGVKHLLSFHDQMGGAIHVYLFTEDDDPKWATPLYTTEQVLKILSQKLPIRLPGAQLSFFTMDVGDPGAERGVHLYLRGDNMETLSGLAKQVAESLSKLPSLRDIKIGAEDKKQEVQVLIDSALAHRAGVSPMIIAQTVDAALRGVRMPYLKQGGREIPVWAQFREEDRRSQANLENIALPGAFNQMTPLHQLTEYAKAPSPSFVKRIDGKNVVRISANTESRNMMAVKREIREIMDNLELPAAYSYLFGDEFEEIDTNLFNFTLTLWMAVILVYLVMCALFESFLLPFSIMTTVPMALVGAAWILYLTATPFDSISLIGCILMAGIIVNNGIVIVDHINQTCRNLRNRDIGVVQAGKDRFRPVMMTAITTILGLVPIAIAKTGGASTFAGLGRVLIGGLATGTLLTLFVVPVFYTLLDDLSVWTKDFLSDVRFNTSHEVQES